MTSVLISGSTGFVGRHVTDYLLQLGLDVQPLKRGVSTDGYCWDNLTPALLDQINVVIHLGGKAHDTKNTSAAHEYFEVNTGLTQKIFDCFLESKASTFIFMSSVKAVADTVTGILTEEDKPDPLTPYGQSKLQAEHYIMSKVLPPNKRLFILRPCMIHGPGNKGNLNLLYQFVQKGLPYPLAGFKNQRSFLSIDNLCFIINKLIADPVIPGGVYNLADDLPLSTNKVITLIAEVNGVKPRLWEISSGLIRFLAKAGDKTGLPLNSERLKKLTESYVVSNAKIKKQLNIKNLPLTSEEGLRLTLKSFRSVKL